MNSIRSVDPRRAQAIALRRAGKSRREIKEILGVGSNTTLNELLAGEPPPEWTRRPNAKDDLHAKARRLREQGYDYNRIAAELGVSKGTVSAWVHDMPWPERLSYEECRKRAAEGARRYWETERRVREARREAARAAASADIGSLTQRELIIAGAIAYWCEGSKNKPYNRQDRVLFVNSDPGLITFFLRFLDAVGIGRERLIYRVQIHESADIAAAEQCWLTLTAAAPDQFRRTTLKRHNPRTVRKNVGDSYHGLPLHLPLAKRGTVLADRRLGTRSHGPGRGRPHYSVGGVPASRRAVTAASAPSVCVWLGIVEATLRRSSTRRRPAWSNWQLIRFWS